MAEEEKPASYGRPLGSEDWKVADRVAELIFAIRVGKSTGNPAEYHLKDAFEFGERFARELRLRKVDRSGGGGGGSVKRVVLG